MENILGSRLKKLREAENLTQKRAASIFGLTNFQLSRYESGQSNPDPDLIKKFAQYYSVTTDYLLGNSSEPKLSADEDKKITEETLRYLKILESLPDNERKVFEEKINDYAEYLRNKMH
ncbi:helix-turn-helix domain-containing protein [Cytobacillus praedii]|uniref:XRE family transcriptional regulator n=1 Tax=Cytobacillus praedii TaxID=1742358 RepID=A0A4R1B3B5_9BACI|nr:helix-turn-helix transcriptional regulator [Cytobacillus praedii]TCJ05073.1 XRE family transcriptional regulator [Cytobacillus praedii]